MSVKDDDPQMIYEQYHEVEEVIKNNQNLYEVICAPVMSATERKNVMSALFADKIDKKLLHFFYILIDKERANIILDVCKKFKQIIREDKNELVGTIFSAKELTDSEIDEFEKKVSKLFSKKVELENEVDTSLISGVKILVNNKIIDVSIKHELEKLKKELRG